MRSNCRVLWVWVVESQALPKNPNGISTLCLLGDRPFGNCVCACVCVQVSLSVLAVFTPRCIDTHLVIWWLNNSPKQWNGPKTHLMILEIGWCSIWDSTAWTCCCSTSLCHCFSHDHLFVKGPVSVICQEDLIRDAWWFLFIWAKTFRHLLLEGPHHFSKTHLEYLVQLTACLTLDVGLCDCFF